MAPLGFLMAASLLVGGCSGDEAEKQVAAPVKVMKVLQRDTPVSYNYAGNVSSKDEVEMHAKVSGMIVEKYFTGGDTVTEGQPLYKIESRQYESELISAEAKLRRAQASLRNATEDLARYERLLVDNAIAEQTVSNKRADVDSFAADVESYAALAQKARENLEDTLVTAPMSGRLGINDVAVGTYATSGSTTLVSIGSQDPVYVQFSVSENEYLEVISDDLEGKEGDFTPMPVHLVLSNGKEYPFEGKLVEADRELGDSTGTLLIKALFPNPKGLLLSGMFAHVRLVGDVTPNALLVPQRAVQQLLDETFVLTVDGDGKSLSKKVKLGEKVGSYYIIKEGLTAEDVVIVEGLTSLKSGQEVTPTMVSPEDMGFTLTTSDKLVNKS